MRRLLLVAVVAVTASLTAVPASGEESSGVLLTYEKVVVPFDSGYHVAVLCNASADPGQFEDIPVATVVTCSVNGRQATRGMPGREAFVHVNATVSEPIVLCLWGEAAFVNPATNEIDIATAGPSCVNVSPS